MNPNTMQRALTQLESEQLVYSQRTAGRFVTGDSRVIEAAKRELALQHVERFLAAMCRLGMKQEEIDGLLRQAEGKGIETDECPDL